MRCVECGRGAKDGEACGWRGVLSGGYDIGRDETVVYCLDCGRREFGEPMGRPVMAVASSFVFRGRMGAALARFDRSG